MNIKDWKEFSDLVDKYNTKNHKKYDKLFNDALDKILFKNKCIREKHDISVKKYKIAKEEWEKNEPKCSLLFRIISSPKFSKWTSEEPLYPRLAMCWSYYPDFSPPTLIKKTETNFWEWKAGKLKLK